MELIILFKTNCDINTSSNTIQPPRNPKKKKIYSVLVEESTSQFTEYKGELLEGTEELQQTSILLINSSWLVFNNVCRGKHRPFSTQH
jgi:hypothetical protein